MRYVRPFPIRRRPPPQCLLSGALEREKEYTVPEEQKPFIVLRCDLVSWGLSLALPLVLQAEAPDTLHVLFS